MEQTKQQHKWNLNFKDLLIGFLVGLCLTLLVAATSSDEGPGRYRCAAMGDDSVFIVDSQTGQTWRLGRGENCDYGTPINRKSICRTLIPMIE
jgi:hypothetical protein